MVPPVLDPTGRSGDLPPIEEEQPLKPTPPPAKILPPPQEPPPDRQKLPLLRVFIKDIRVDGSTVFSQSELDQVLASYKNRTLTTEDLQEVRQALTLLYVKNGYINSGAVLPDQAVQDGVITIQVIEGELTDVVIEGTTHFLPSYLETRIRLSADRPLNINRLRERLQLLLQDSRFRRVNSELKPGARPGQSVLVVRVEEASPYKAWAEFNNFQSPTVGAERGIGTIAHQNPLGLGDIFTLSYGRSEGLDPQLGASYTLPFTAWDTTFQVQYRKNNFGIIEAPFNTLNLESESDVIQLAIRQPVYRTLTNEVALSVGIDRLRNQITLFGQGTNIFTPGASSNGESVVSALRFVQEWIHRQRQDVVAFRSQMNWGIDVLGATNNGSNLPDTQFFSWLGQAQWGHRFDPSGVQLLNRMVLQVANDRLFSLEQIAVGGRFSVRGYRENTLVKDNAFVYSFETRMPVFPEVLGPNFLVSMGPFLDVGRAWNNKVVNTGPETLASVGLGLQVSLYQRAHFSVYWGVPLNHVPTPGGNLQDDGIHLQFVMDILD